MELLCLKSEQRARPEASGSHSLNPHWAWGSSLKRLKNMENTGRNIPEHLKLLNLHCPHLYPDARPHPVTPKPTGGAESGPEPRKPAHGEGGRLVSGDLRREPSAPIPEAQGSRRSMTTESAPLV